MADMNALVDKLNEVISKAPAFPAFDKTSKEFITTVADLSQQIKAANDELPKPESPEDLDKSLEGADQEVIDFAKYKAKLNLYDQAKLDITNNIFHNFNLEQLQELEVYLKSITEKYKMFSLT